MLTALLAQTTDQDLDQPLRVPPAVFLVAAALAAGFAIYLLQQRRTGTARDRSLRELAQRRGWRFSAADPAGLGGLRFRQFANAKGALVTNVITTDHGRGRVRVFDYSLMYEHQRDGDASLALSIADGVFGTESERAQSTVRSYTKRRSAGVVRVEAFLPPFAATPASLLTRAVERAGVPDHDFESTEFNRHWDVRCGDERFSWLFCDASMIDLILQIGRGATLETFGNYVLVTRDLLSDAGDVERFLDTLDQIPSNLNPLIAAEYPTVAEMESRSMIDAWQHRPDGAKGVY